MGNRLREQQAQLLAMKADLQKTPEFIKAVNEAKITPDGEWLANYMAETYSDYVAQLPDSRKHESEDYKGEKHQMVMPKLAPRQNRFDYGQWDRHGKPTKGRLTKSLQGTRLPPLEIIRQVYMHTGLLPSNWLVAWRNLKL